MSSCFFFLCAASELFLASESEMSSFLFPHIFIQFLDRKKAQDHSQAGDRTNSGLLSLVVNARWIHNNSTCDLISWLVAQSIWVGSENDICSFHPGCDHSDSCQGGDLSRMLKVKTQLMNAMEKDQMKGAAPRNIYFAVVIPTWEITFRHGLAFAASLKAALIYPFIPTMD